MDRSSIRVITTVAIVGLLFSSLLIVADAFMGRRDMEMELLLIKLLQNRRQKQQQQVIPIPIYIPRCRGHPPRAESQHYPVYVPIHTHEHHILESPSHLNFDISPCSSNTCSSSHSSSSHHSSASPLTSSPSYHQLLQLQESI